MSNWLGHAFEGLLGQGARGGALPGHGWLNRHAAEGRGFVAGAALVGLMVLGQQHDVAPLTGTAADVRLESVAGAVADYARELRALDVSDPRQLDALRRLSAQLDGVLDPLAGEGRDGWVTARTELVLRPASDD